MQRSIALVALAALVSGCSTSATAPSALPAGKPFLANAPAAQSPIQHVIVVIQENRTMDNMFSGFPGADTVTVGKNHYGNDVTLQPEGLEWRYDPSHAHEALVAEYNNGKMNGFDKDPCDFDPLGFGSCHPPKDYTYSYVPKEEVQFLWILAGEFASVHIGYGLADRMFASRQVPSFPGHQYLIAGQSIAAGNPFGKGSAIWGCDAPRTTRIHNFGAKYADPLETGRPCYDYQTIGDLMDAKGVSWKYYTGAITTDDGEISAYQAVKHIRYGADWNKDVIAPMTDIFSDIENNTLPAVSFVTPPGPASDHAGYMTSGGPAWVTTIYAYLTKQHALYGNTTILVTWDDSGGWYDHVAPPSDGFGPLGFRVPLMVMSPYARQKVSHKVHSFGSILRYIEDNWKLGSLGQQDAVSDNLSDMFDYKQTPIPPVSNFGSFHTSEFLKKYNKQYWEAVARDPRPVDTDR